MVTVTSLPTAEAVTPAPTKFNEARAEVNVVPSSLTIIGEAISLVNAIVPVVLGKVQVFALPVVDAETNEPPKPILNPKPLFPTNLFAVISYAPTFQFAVKGTEPSALT